MMFPTECDRFFSEAKEIWQSRGDIGALKEYISSIQDQDYRESILGKVGVFLSEQGRDEEGLQFIRSIEQPIERADAFLSLGREHARRNDIGNAKASLMEAIVTAETIQRSTWETAAILLQVSTDLYRLDFKADALSALRRAVALAQRGGDFDSAKVIGGAAVQLAHWGRIVTQPELQEATEKRVQQVVGCR